MQSLLTESRSLQAEAIDWARSFLEVDAVEAVRETDWAKTFRLDGVAASAYLKLVPGNRARQLGSFAEIAERFPQRVPRVLGVDADRGWLLTADHDGERIDDEESEQQLRSMLETLAEMQALAIGDPAFVQRLEAFDPSQMPDQLLAFLEFDDSSKAADQPPFGASRFIGAAAAERYLRLLKPRLSQLREHIARSAGLPPTLVHGDLHTGNGAVHADGRCILLDWDECAAGPAGSCVHGLFDGCTVPAILLARWAATGQPADTVEGRLLAAYVERLVAGGYSSRADLIAGLSGAICAGQIRFILTYGQFPFSAGSKRTAPSIIHLLDNLLDLCDWLSAPDHRQAMGWVADYIAAQEWERAQQLLQDQVARWPGRADLLAQFGTVSRCGGDLEAAAEAGREAVELEPTRAEWRLELAKTDLERMELAACRAGLDRARQLDPSAAGLAELTARLDEFSAAVDDAARPHGWARVRVTAAERGRGRLDADTMALLLHLFRLHGVVQIDQVFDPAYVQALHQTFLQRYQRQLDERAQQNHLQVGDKRYMLTLEMDDAFGSAELIASPMLLPVMKGILGDNCVLGAYTAVISLPGSEDQQLHKDHTALFDETGWQREAPSFAAQIILPLVQMDENTGTTRCFKDTQGIPYGEAADKPFHDPVVPQGSCLLIDYSTVHQGLANRSGRVRPIVALAYSRPWFRDVWNYHLQPAMRFSSKFFDRAPAAVRKLIAWREIERRTVLQDDSSWAPPER